MAEGRKIVLFLAAGLCPVILEVMWLTSAEFSPSLPELCVTS